MIKIVLNAEDQKKQELLSARLAQHLMDKDARQIRNRILSEFLDSDEHSLDLKKRVASSTYVEQVACQIWAYKHFDGVYLERLFRFRPIRRETVLHAARNKAVTWDMVHIVLTSKSKKLSGVNVNRFIRSLNPAVVTEEFMVEFFKFINGRDEISIGKPRTAKTPRAILDMKVVYDHARRVFGLEGYPDEWVQQVISGYIEE